MGALWLPCIPQWDRGPGHSGTSGTCQAGAARNSLPFFATPLCWPMLVCQLQTAGRPGWHAKKWQQGTFPRDIVQKEPKSGALGPNVSHWRSQEKINCAVKLRGEFALEAASDGAPQCQPCSSPWRGCSPSPTAWGGQPCHRAQMAPLGLAVSTLVSVPPFSSHERVKIPNQFSRVPSMLLNTVLVSSVHFQQNVAFVHCSGYFLCAIGKHFLGVAFSQLLPPAADSFTVNIYVRNSKNFFTSLAHSVLWQAGWLNNYGQVC